ncbi:hypothetical protein AYR62_03995 [Secundilactobacillus paracollinoides]|uniref:Uncharacterized protein n=1 Tax=Secundilactobacillus paracollinoides TaxID=240427 RepID=A0A1B2J007_9LACO|nr:hypothetical protein AYR61_10285 [Secundilactobacillus paracollinoides]ANZ63344.1 hypothetical protein AYR62_03995 [Secundilactobacillus paracollinoides]ANZ67627.1 hypothetical protein AYR63_11030 [Secundilactobacillus paracollinoides]
MQLSVFRNAFRLEDREPRKMPELAFTSELAYMQLSVFRNAFRLEDREPRKMPELGIYVRVGLHAAFCFPKRVSAQLSSKQPQHPNKEST